MAARPNHVVAQAGALTRAASQAAFTHIIGTTIGDATGHITDALNRYGVDDVEGLLAIPHNDIDGLQYQPAPVAGVAQPLAPLLPARRNLIKAWLALHANYSRDLGQAIDVTTVVQDDFNNWRVSGYDPNSPIVPFAAPLPVAPAPPAGGLTPAQSFSKGVR